MLLKYLLFTGGGAVLGYLYHILIGCQSGHCPITANPFISTLYGAVLGFLIAGMVRKPKHDDADQERTSS